MENLGADLGLVVLSPFWAHGHYVEAVAPQEELRRAGWGASGERNTQGQAFPPTVWTVVQIGATAEMLLRQHSFAITAMARSGVLSHDVPLAFAFICLFIYFDNPPFRDGLCSEGIRGLSRQFLTLFTQGICFHVYFIFFLH